MLSIFLSNEEILNIKQINPIALKEIAHFVITCDYNNNFKDFIRKDLDEKGNHYLIITMRKIDNKVYYILILIKEW